MNPLVKKLIGAGIRYVLTTAAIAVDVSDSQIETYVDALIVVAVGGWSVIQKIRSQKETNTALALPKGSTAETVQQAIAETGGAPAMVPADVAPRMVAR